MHAQSDAYTSYDVDEFRSLIRPGNRDYIVPGWGSFEAPVIKIYLLEIWSQKVCEALNQRTPGSVQGAGQRCWCRRSGRSMGSWLAVRDLTDGRGQPRSDPRVLPQDCGQDWR